MKTIVILALALVLTSAFRITKPHSKTPLKAGYANDLVLYYCGFGDKFCGQSVDDDVNPGASIIILAFVNTQTDGSVIMDEANFPSVPFQAWKAAGKKVLLSVGGQNGNWQNVFASSASIDNFAASLVDYVDRFDLDGVDLDIQNYNTPPTTVANAIIKLKTDMNNLGKGYKLLTTAPECVVIYQAMGVPDADTGSGYYNYFVNIVKQADDYIDFYMPQAYNNWYQFPSGSVEFLQDVYLNWRNFQGMTPWGSDPIPGFQGVAGEKIYMGILASTVAGGSAYYYTPDVINAFQAWLQDNNYPMAGFMSWDSHWDTVNGRQMSDAVLS